MPVTKLVLGGLAVLLAAPIASAQDLRLRDIPTRWRFTGEYFSVDAHEHLGLVGVHYDVLDPFPAVPHLYLGVGGYGAVAGRRGGLFAGGLTAGYLRELAPGWAVDAGLFAGGGGGGGRVSGEGIEGPVLRPHLALERTFPLYSLRLELANTDFLDDEIDDLHLALGLSLPSEILHARESGRVPSIPADAVVKRRVRVTPQVSVFDPARGLNRLSGTPLERDIKTTGFGVDYFLGEHFFVPIEAHGATSGSVSGFGVALTGIGFSLPLAFADRLTLELATLAGAAGGGDVDTGGGFLWLARGGLKIPLYGPLSLSISHGATEAVKGDFEANVTTVGLTWESHLPELAADYPRSRLAKEGLTKETAKINPTRLQALDKMYVPRSKSHYRHGGRYESTINLLGVGFAQPVSESFSILGHVYSAWEGDVSGYSEGLIGLGYEFAPLYDERHRFYTSVETGSGGGGDVDVGSGLIYELGAGYRYDLTESVSLSLGAGYMEADHGSFAAETYQIGLSWHLGRAFLK
ncbi:MAG: hypothetical protein AB1726_08930 [Planctomycetota bacterium]